MSIDHAVREISSAYPRLRRDVRTHYQEFRGKPSYIVEDTARGKFYHLGFPEHQFIQCLDGKTTISRALAENAATQGEDALTEQQADRLIRLLVDNDLLETESSGQADRRREQWSKKKDKEKNNWLTKIFFFKFPLGCPDRFLKSSAARIGWIFSIPCLLLWLVLISYAGIELARNWDVFIAATGNVIAPGNWWRIALIYVGLKLIHEMGHGIATRRFGGSVPEWGVMVLLFVTPLAYVDASTSWRFHSRAHRILVSLAGMYVELAIAALCVIAWTRTDPGTLGTTLHSAIFAASTVTLLFNANPLMRFDGYYVLVDLLGIPNLGNKGQYFLSWLGKRVFLGMKELSLPVDVRLRPIAIPLYGILAAVWKIIVWVGILIILSLLAKGAGLFLVLLSIGTLAIGSLIKFSRFLFIGNGGQKPDLSRALPRLTFFLIAVAATLWFVKVDPAGRAVGVVEFAGKETIRVGCNGVVDAVLVEPGQVVEKGSLLLQMSNPDEETARDQLRLELSEARIRARRYFQSADLTAFQAEQGNIKGLEKNLNEKDLYLAQLELKAPISGRIVARNLNELQGQWLRVGEKILAIAPSDEMELLVSFRQRDIDSIQRRKDDSILLRLRGHSHEIPGSLTRVETRATRAIPHEVLVSSSGGPLALRARNDPYAERDREIAKAGQGSAKYDTDLDYFANLEEQGRSAGELAGARFAGRAILRLKGQLEESEKLREGEWGYVRLANAGSEPLGLWFYDGISGYIQRRIENARAATGSR